MRLTIAFFLCLQCNETDSYVVSMREMDYNQLLKNCLKQKPDAQKMLYEHFAPSMLGVCFRYTKSISDAEEVLQEGFIKVFKNLQKFRSEGSFEGWVRRIFVNTAIEHYRKKVKLYNVTEVQENTVEDASLDALDSLATKDILKVINELSPGYKAVFNMHVIEGYSHKEIADILGITEGTSKSQLARAKGVLKKLLENYRKAGNKENE